MREKKKLSFLKEISMMMYGYGDVRIPRHDTTQTVHDYMIGYMKGLLVKTHNMAKNKGKTKTDDLMYFLKRDKKKYNRVKELLKISEEVKIARKLYDFERFEKE
ncbi:transcription initiation factor TFIID subunit [Tubulinosema ratisbonensis]|uniref:Transcription initiation factor TFIID subunit 13 n=1 Tax=Tubulinosema ratisbonensis TaxID=291195 RepID=A0A437ANN3_9MICR|nr:transcription initiation factor TFIID subunit [Tubulinosema ratisbonensis]